MIAPSSSPIPRLGRHPSRGRVLATPVLTVLIGSTLPALLPIIVQSPTLPPLGLLFLVGWRLLHPELWPLWIGAPLGLYDDLMSGQAPGSAMFLWSVIMIGIELLDARMLWRDYWQDWAIAAVACLVFLGGSLLLAHIGGSRAPLHLILPQWLWSVLLYPLIVRFIALIDRWRMMA